MKTFLKNLLRIFQRPKSKNSDSLSPEISDLNMNGSAQPPVKQPSDSAIVKAQSPAKQPSSPTNVESGTKPAQPERQSIQRQKLHLQLRVYIEKIEGKGEDAEPILASQESRGLLAVFDGLGGSGSTTYADRDGNAHSGAFYAARLARKKMNDLWNKSDVAASGVKGFSDVLEANLYESFQQAGAKFSPASPSILKGNTLKKFPTTIASIMYHRLTSADLPPGSIPERLSAGSYQATYIWAGDSRCYAMQPATGLQQLTKDDTVFQSDAYTSLYSDPPISKTVNAEDKINLNRGTIFITTPSILFACSDGCYNYLETPMQFEHLILETLYASENMDQWGEWLRLSFEKIAADDVSLALVGLGWNDFLELKEKFRTRYQFLKANFTDQIYNGTLQIQKLESDLKASKTEHERIKADLWSQYKENYEKYIR